MSLSDFESDLTELSSSDEEYIPVSLKPQKKKAPSKPNAEYKVTNALRPPRTTSYTARSLYDQIIDGAIILDPPYQRDVVWSEPKQVGLIDSLLRNYYIPPLIFAVTSRDDGTESRVCIDGKQRLTSIQQFMDGLICHKDTFTNKKYWFKGGTGKRVPLPKQYLQAFANKQIVCVEYDSLSDDQEREIFRRVQMGVALTPAERMQAIAGPWTTLIRDIQLKVLGEDGFGEDLDWGHARGRDFQCLASIVYLIDNYPTSKFPDATQLEKWLSSSGPVSANFQEGIMDTFRIFIALVKDSKYNAAFQKPTRVSPIEFTMTGVLIHLYRLKFSLQQLSSAIWKMRADVRTKHVDVRANTKVASTMYTFITEDIKGIELQGDEKGDSPAVTMIKSASLTCKLSKREREEDTSDNEYEEHHRKPPPRRYSRTGTSKRKRQESGDEHEVPLKKPQVTSTSRIASAKSTRTTKSKPAATKKSVTKLISTASSKPIPTKTPPGKRLSTKQCLVPSSATSPKVMAASSLPRSNVPLKLPRTGTQSSSSVQSASPPCPLPDPVKCPFSSAHPLALPRRQIPGNMQQVHPLQVKVGPEANARLSMPSTSPLLARSVSIGSSTIDVMASTLFANTSANGNVTLQQSPVVLSANRNHVTDPNGQPADTGSPNVPRKQQQDLSPIDTSLPSGRPLHGRNTDPSSVLAPSLSTGRQIDQGSIEQLLTMHGFGQSHPLQSPFNSFSQPQSQSSVGLQSPHVPVASRLSTTPTIAPFSSQCMPSHSTSLTSANTSDPLPIAAQQGPPPRAPFADAPPAQSLLPAHIKVESDSTADGILIHSSAPCGERIQDARVPSGPRNYRDHAREWEDSERRYGRRDWGKNYSRNWERYRDISRDIRRDRWRDGEYSGERQQRW